jgi:ribonucleoside-diphosphate reductase alpha chain
MEYSKNALTIYKNLYLNDDEKTPQEVHDRVATCIAKDENQQKLFKHLLNENIFRPNSPTLINADYPEKFKKRSSHDRNLAACFVVDLKDDMNSIMQMWNVSAWVYAGGGGCGFPLTQLREEYSPISGGGKASGPISYAKVIEAIADSVKSGGKARRAANLASLSYNHPQIRDLITMKKYNKLVSFNISILVDDWFMKQVADKNFNAEYYLVSPNKQTVTESVTVGEVWKLMIDNAWETGDPGLLFYDVANRYYPLPSQGPVNVSNPCGEVLLPGNECCILGSLNLNKFIDCHQFDFEKFKEYVRHSVDFLNCLIDTTSYPNEEFEKHMLATRPIGLGIMGLADIFVKLGISYGSKESVTLFEQICKTLTKEAFEHSIDLAEKYPEKIIEINGQDFKFFRNLLKEKYEVSDEYMKKFDENGIVNCQTTSIPPTGSVSISSDCSYSFEPYFAVCWRKKLDSTGEVLDMINPLFIEYCQKYGVELTKEILDEINNHNGSVANVDQIPEELKKLFKCAHDISIDEKMRLHAAGQKYITLGISNTYNLPTEATKEDVEKVYVDAWKNELKGVTIFRNGCLGYQPVEFKKEENKNDIHTIQGIKTHNNLKKMVRPIKRMGPTFEIKTPHNDGNLFINPNYDCNGNVFELFLRMGNQAGLANQLLDAISKSVSKGLQYGIPLEEYVKSFSKIGGTPFFMKLDDNVSKSVSCESIMGGLAKILDYHFLKGDLTGVNYLKENNNDRVEKNNEMSKCPMCNKYTLTYDMGCRGGICINEECNYTSCG